MKTNGSRAYCDECPVPKRVTVLEHRVRRFDSHVAELTAKIDGAIETLLWHQREISTEIARLSEYVATLSPKRKARQ